MTTKDRLVRVITRREPTYYAEQLYFRLRSVLFVCMYVVVTTPLVCRDEPLESGTIAEM
jgi:hypothetical protein